MPHDARFLRSLPVRPQLDQLARQAEELLGALRADDPNATLDDAQRTLAQSYDAPDWAGLLLACRMADAIWRDDVAVVRRLVAEHPSLLDQDVLIRKPSNWGPPLTYAANLGRDRIVDALLELGAGDLASAFARAALQGRIGTARRLHERLGSPQPSDGALNGPAYTLNAPGTGLLFELGARGAPAHVVLETDARDPQAKHRILELYVAHGASLPDTPAMALHRGRIDLLEEHLRRDPALLRRTLTHEEIFPPELGCHDEVLATHGTPLAGATLLHMAVDYDELEIARWLLARGMDVDARAAVDAEGFGGHTALFATVVSQPNFWMNQNGGPQVAPWTELLLAHGADPNARASLRKQLHPGYGPDTLHEYRGVTPLSWGERFHHQIFVSAPAMRLIAERASRP